VDRQLRSAYDDGATGVAVDGAGGVHVVGLTDGALPGRTRAGKGDAFLVRYGPGGRRLQLRQFGSAAWDSAYGVAVDAAGDAYVVGDTGGALPGQSNAGGPTLSSSSSAPRDRPSPAGPARPAPR